MNGTFFAPAKFVRGDETCETWRSFHVKQSLKSRQDLQAPQISDSSIESMFHVKHAICADDKSPADVFLVKHVAMMSFARIGDQMDRKGFGAGRPR
jgi:hypothetical protein